MLLAFLLSILLHATSIDNHLSHNSFRFNKQAKLLPFYGKIKLRFLVSSELDSYFKSVSLKVPSCLNNSKTILNKRIIRSLVFLSRYLMNSGFLLRCLTTLNKVLSHCFTERAKFIDLHIRTGEIRALDSSSIAKFNYKAHTSTKMEVFPQLNARLLSLKPLFYFYIYKVDKQIYKNSRGKSGKYTFLWKYVQSFKRPNLVTNLLTKDIRFNTSRNFFKKILNSILRHTNSLQNTFTYKSIKFSNNYAFLNSKKTLLMNFRTTKSS